MKIRNGFVSNSSSSSFLIGIGILSAENKDKFLKEAETLNLDNHTYLYDLFNLEEIKNQESDCIGIGESDVFINTFDDTEVRINIKEIKDSDYILGFYFGHDAETNDDGEIIDEEFYFEGFEEKVYDLFHKYCDSVDVASGVGYNG